MLILFRNSNVGDYLSNKYEALVQSGTEHVQLELDGDYIYVNHKVENDNCKYVVNLNTDKFVRTSVDKINNCAEFDLLFGNSRIEIRISIENRQMPFSFKFEQTSLNKIIELDGFYNRDIQIFDENKKCLDVYHVLIDYLSDLFNNI